MRWAVRLFCVLPALLAAYATLALLLGLLPVNRDWRPSGEGGVPVYLVTNGVHAMLQMPVRNTIVDWSRPFPVQNVQAGEAVDNRPWINIGWGDRRFFLATRSWSDLTPGNAVYALSGLDSAIVHVEYQSAVPKPGASRLLYLRPEEYARLVAFIRSSIPLGANGRALWLDGYHYGQFDAFYQADGHYSLFNTCNQWVRNALAATGVRTANWSPLDRALFWQLDRVSDK